MTLPQFLLTYAQSRWVWFGFRPPLPAPNARFSFTRVLALSALQVLLGVVLGGFLSLLFSRYLFHAPTTWIIWLLAAFSACQGLICCSLTALCWNQRAARLRANPALDIRLPPARYPFFRGLLGSVYFLLLAVLTPAAVLWTIENVRGELLWRSERNRWVSQGERLTFREILGPEIPPEQNAGAAPVFAPFFNYRYARVPGSHSGFGEAVWEDTNSLSRIEERLRFPDSFAPSKPKDAESTPAIDLVAWADAYRAIAASKSTAPSWASELKLPDSTNDPARVVLAGLSVADTELAAICDAASRPRAQFPVHYDEAFNALLRHLGIFKATGFDLERRCAAHLAVGDTNAAFADAECAFRLSETLREEPLLISQLVRYAMANIAARTIWQGLAQHRWDDAQLAAFQEQLAKVDFLPGIALAFEGERAGSILTIDTWITRPGTLSGMVGPTESGSPADFPAGALSRGMLRQNQIAIACYHSQMISMIRAAISNAPQAGLAQVAKTAADTAALEALVHSHSPYRMLAAMLAPATQKALGKTARAQTIVRMTMIACALERYHLRHGSFPETLDEMVPAILPGRPLDPMNNQPFHYHRTDDGWFELYSVGLNARDDNGIFKLKNAEEEKDLPWPVPSRPARWNLF